MVKGEAMTESDCKLLMEWLGECWHPDRDCQTGKCYVCGSIAPNRTFTIWADFGACWERLVEKGQDDVLTYFAWGIFCGGNPYSINDLLPRITYWRWFHGETDDGTYRLCNLIAQAIKEWVI